MGHGPCQTFSHVRVTSYKRDRIRTFHRQRAYILGATFVVVQRRVIPVLHLQVVPMTRHTQGAKSEQGLPPERHALRMDLFRDLVFSIWYPQADAILQRPECDPFSKWDLKNRGIHALE